MDELARTPERILIDCLRALDGGATSDDCLSRYPQQVDSLRGFLAMRAQLLTPKTTAPSPTAFVSGREALLARVVRPLASSHPGSTETQGRQARGLLWRPATRVAFAGALLFAMAGCALGVSATPGVDKAREALPSLPDIPHHQPPYPFPKFNVAPPSALPTAEPSQPSNDAPAGPAPAEQPQTGPTTAPAGPQNGSTPSDAQPQPEPTKPASPSDSWVPPVNAHENGPTADATATPEPTAEPDDNAADSPANTPNDEANEPADTSSQDSSSSHNSKDGDGSAHNGASQDATPDNSSATDNESSSDESRSTASTGDNTGSPDATLTNVAPPS